MKRFFTALLLLISTSMFAQSAEEHWAKWNKNYPEQNITQMLKGEKSYADSVEKHPEIAPYYIRVASYRFNAKYLGKVRPIDKAVIQSVKNVCLLTKRDTATIAGLLDKEVLLKVGDQEIWMAVQIPIVKDFEHEVKPGDMVKVYCAYFNEHNSKNILYNTFVISEFIDKP
jgi:hypothetical protein